MLVLKKHIILITFLIFLHLGLYTNIIGSPSPVQTYSPPTSIEVVMDNNYPPYVFVDSKGNLEGILIDQWKLWEKKTGIKVQITAMGWGIALKQMERKKYDVIDTIFYNPNRAKIYDFTKPYATIDVPIFFHKNISGINNVESLHGFNIAVKKGDNCIEILRQNGINDLQEYDSYEAIIKAAKEKKLMVFVIDKPPALYFLYKYGIQEDYHSTDPLYSGKFHRAVIKGNTALLKRVEDGFKKISSSEYNAIDRKWFGTSLIKPRYWEYTATIIGSIFIIILLLLLWTRTLQSRVKHKTAELETVLQQYKLSEERYRMLAENSHDIIALQDIQSRYIYLSPAIKTILGYKPDELKGHSPQEFIHPDDQHNILMSHPKQLPAGVSSKLVEYRFLAKDGSYHWLESVVKPVFDAENHLIFYQSVNRDITERKNAEIEKHRFEEQVQHTQKLESLGVLAGGIAHDFNNLLVAILGNIDLVNRSLPADSTIRNYIKDAENASLRAAELARQMLAYSGKGKFQIQPIYLNDIVDSMTQILDISISKKSVLQYHLNKSIPLFKGDISQVQQIIMNLIINASESLMDKTGTIHISTDTVYCDNSLLSKNILRDELPEGQYVFLEVKDNGCGMDAVTLRKIFDPFFTTKFTGRGLGLSAVLGIVRGHKGMIIVESELKKGTLFRVFFPALPDIVMEESTMPAKDVNVPVPPKPEKHNALVLLVDDDASVRSLAQRMIEHMGFRVISADNGKKALEIFNKSQEDNLFNEHIDCVLLDLTMPEMDGEETFHELRKINAHIPILLSSGYSEQEINERFAGQGLNGFIQKPYQLNEIEKKIRQVLS